MFIHSMSPIAKKKKNTTCNLNPCIITKGTHNYIFNLCIILLVNHEEECQVFDILEEVLY